MKIVQAQKIDSVADYQLIELATPLPSAGEVLVKVHACGMGYVDALVALGRYQVKPPTPFIPGQEVGGIVEAVGDGVSHLNVGDRVMASSFGGGLAEFVVVPAVAASKIPDLMSFDQAAAFNINYVTALHALKDRAGLQQGERLLVFGAAGGVGTAAVQLGRLLGAEVIAVGSTPEKRAFAERQGAHRVLDTGHEGWRLRLKAACGGQGPDIVFDPVCGPLFEPAFRSQSWRGRYLVVGFAGGPIPKLPVNLPLMKGASLVGVDVRQFFIFEPKHAREHMAQLLTWVAERRLDPPVGRRFSLGAFAEAMEFAMSGQGMGKAVVGIAE